MISYSDSVGSSSWDWEAVALLYFHSLIGHDTRLINTEMPSKINKRLIKLVSITAKDKGKLELLYIIKIPITTDILKPVNITKLLKIINLVLPLARLHSQSWTKNFKRTSSQEVKE